MSYKAKIETVWKGEEVKVAARKARISAKRLHSHPSGA